MTAGALEGIVVLDLTNFLSGPYCTMLLADMGADVIKVERPDGGDDARRMPPFVEGRGQPFAVWNRNKRSVTADLKNPEDVENLADEEDSEEEEEEVQPPPKKKAKVEKEVGVHILTVKQVMEMLRLQHALVHASIQGRTMRNEHIGILDCFTPNFTMRNMIVAMSRATHGKFVHVFSSEQQRDLLKHLQTKN